MTSNNIQKIVQNNFHLNPWVLSKNTNEIVNTYIQKIYKQMPFGFRKDPKPPKIAAERPENKAPIRTFKSQQMTEEHTNRIVPQTMYAPLKKSARSKPTKLNHERLIKILGTSSTQSNQQIRKKSTATINSVFYQKKPLKSPNLKIYGSRRYGSSASSSRSSLFRRNEAKRRQHQSVNQNQMHFMSRAYHSGHLHDSIAKCLMPLRNQQVKGNLGCLPEAMRVSSTIQNDLMAIDEVLRNRISVNGGRKTIDTPQLKMSMENDRLKVWKHPPPLEKFPIHKINELLAKSSQNPVKTLPEKPRLNKSGCGGLFKHSPTNEVDFVNSELKECHRRNRMKKLGLINDSPKPRSTNNVRNLEKSKSQQVAELKINANNKGLNVGRHSTKNETNMKTLVEPKRNLTSTEYGNIISPPTIPHRLSTTDLIVTPSTSESSTLPDRSNGPLALATANLSAMLASKRFDRSSYLAMVKY
uniref:Uncharacterized protein n=1 Tax=Musca domestica TaxID=7370 RepID=A0A1I8MB54_MUSDO